MLEKYTKQYFRIIAIAIVKIVSRHHFLRECALRLINSVPFIETRIRVFAFSNGIFSGETGNSYIDELLKSDLSAETCLVNPIDCDYFDINVVERMRIQYVINFDFELLSRIRKNRGLDYETGIAMGIDTAIVYVYFAAMKRLPSREDVDRFTRLARVENNFDVVFKMLINSREHSTRGYFDIENEELHQHH